MSDRIARRWCRACKEMRKVVSPRMKHGWHFLFTLLTFGLWGIGWVLLTITAPGWRCDLCGSNRTQVWTEKMRTRARAEGGVPS